MKKVILSLVAVVAAMTVNAQTVTLLKNDVVVDTYPASEVDKVVFNNSQLIEANGHAYVDLGITDAQGNPIYFSNCNLNETTPDAQEADYGTYYKGQTSDKANEVLGGTWTMNAKEGFEKLFASNGVEIAYNVSKSGHLGVQITKVDDATKYIFIPYAGNVDLSGSQTFNAGNHVWIQLDENGTEYLHIYYNSAADYGYEFLDGASAAWYAQRGTSIRPVLVVQGTPGNNNNGPTTGTAASTLGDLPWVQLWAGGPKFCDSYTAGTFEDATKTGADFILGSNWRTVSRDEMQELIDAAQGTSTKVSCEYVQNQAGKWGFKFTGIESDYANNSVFLLADSSATATEAEAFYWTSDPWGPLRGIAIYLKYNSTGTHGYGAYCFSDYNYIIPVVLSE